LLPPRLVRRLVLAPMVIVIALGVILLSPLLAVLALLFGLAGLSRAGRMRNLRLLSFAVVWLTAEIVALFILLGLWIISRFGGRLRTEPYQSRHYAVIRRFLDTLYRGAERTYGLRVEVEEPEPPAAEQAARPARPVIVLSRHAGPGDSFLLVHQLLSVYGRRPRVVMKAALQFDPSLDVVGNRLPNVFVHHRKTGESIFTEQIERLARGLDPTGALVIFPEGANWTPARWRRGIRRLEHAGRADLAARARNMPNLLPPRPGGTLAAINACPEADVIFVAHAGLDTILGVGDVWRRFPVDQVIRARWWRVPSDRVPPTADHEAQVRWLYDWWERIDGWITENRPGGAAVPVIPRPETGPAGRPASDPGRDAPEPGLREGQSPAALAAQGLTWTAAGVADVDDRDGDPDQRNQDYLGGTH
jgi:1-acyl-sn-glycerol-3-phosphate acyltransferase